MHTKTYKDVWVFTEQREGILHDVGLELLGVGRKLAAKIGWELCAVVLGHEVGPLAEELATFGADRIYLADAPILSEYRGEAYAPVLESLVNQYRPSILLIGGTSLGMDLAPRVAAKAGTGLSAHCVDLDVDEGGCLTAKVPAFGGSVVASITCPRRRPQMATIPPGFMKKAEPNPGRKTVVEAVKVEVTESQVRTKVVEVIRQEPKSRPIDQADIAVCGGFGIGSKENWRLVEELAAVLGGSVGATRPACDEGWARLEEQMVGQSGKNIHPELYIGIGISGMMHHLIGIRGSKVIVAINTDAAAPIMKAADYAVIGDYRQFVPVLIEELKRVLRGG